MRRVREGDSLAELRLMPKEGSADATPKWITQELIDMTLRVWQPRYGGTLTAEDAVAMLIDAARLLEVVTNRSAGRG